MKIAMSMLFLFGAVSVAQAQNGSGSTQWQSPNSAQQPGLMTCWYNESGAYTGADSAQSGARAGGPYRTADQGDYAWSYNIRAPNGQSCPPTKPASHGHH